MEKNSSTLLYSLEVLQQLYTAVYYLYCSWCGVWGTDARKMELSLYGHTVRCLNRVIEAVKTKSDARITSKMIKLLH